GPAPGPQWAFAGTGSAAANVNALRPGDLRLLADPALAQDCWVGVLACDRLLEAAPPGDFTLDTKLDTLPPPRGAAGEYHSAGILVWQDAANFLRFEVQAQGGAGQVVVAHKVIGGVGADNVVTSPPGAFAAPLYLRVTRAGASWALLYSGDGATFTTVGSFSQALGAGQVGLELDSVGNLAAFPYADFDYFRLSQPPPNPSPSPTAVPSSTPGPTQTPAPS